MHEQETDRVYSRVFLSPAEGDFHNIAKLVHHAYEKYRQKHLGEGFVDVSTEVLFAIEEHQVLDGLFLDRPTLLVCTDQVPLASNPARTVHPTSLFTRMREEIPHARRVIYCCDEQLGQTLVEAGLAHAAIPFATNKSVDRVVNLIASPELAPPTIGRDTRSRARPLGRLFL